MLPSQNLTTTSKSLKCGVNGPDPGLLAKFLFRSYNAVKLVYSDTMVHGHRILFF